MRRAAVSLALALSFGCAGSAPPAETTPEAEAFEPRVSSDEQRAGEALDRLMVACGEGDLATAASGIVDRDLPSAEWHRAMDVEEPGRREAVERLCERVVGAQRGGGYQRVAYRKERQGEQRWHLCTVRYEVSTEEEIYAFLEIGGEMLLADIDPVR